MVCRIAVCDNEGQDRQRIEQFLQRYAFEHQIKLFLDSYCCGEDLVQAYREEKKEYDIIILEVKMEGMDGIETAERIRKISGNHVLITFVTSCREQVYRSFDVQAFQYLIKPLEYIVFHQKMTDMIAALTDERTHIMVVSQKDGELFLNLNEIVCIETVKQMSGRGKLEITLLQDKLVVTGTLNDYEDKLQQEGFVRIHRTVLVNLRFVHSFRGDHVILRTGKELPLSKKYARKVRESLSGFFVMGHGRQ